MNTGTCSQLYYTVLAPAECICLYRSGVSILVTLYINAFTFRLTSKRLLTVLVSSKIRWIASPLVYDRKCKVSILLLSLCDVCYSYPPSSQ